MISDKDLDLLIRVYIKKVGSVSVRRYTDPDPGGTKALKSRKVQVHYLQIFSCNPNDIHQKENAYLSWLQWSPWSSLSGVLSGSFWGFWKCLSITILIIFCFGEFVFGDAGGFKGGDGRVRGGGAEVLRFKGLKVLRFLGAEVLRCWGSEVLRLLSDGVVDFKSLHLDMDGL